MLDKLFVTMFRLCRIARSSTTVFVDLLLACCLADAACAIMNIMTALIFIILIVSRLHAFSLVVPIRSSLHVLVEVAVISYFQQKAARFKEIKRIPVLQLSHWMGPDPVPNKLSD